MSWEPDDEERRLVLALPPKERYSYLVQLLVDLLYPLMDPRVRLGQEARS